MALVPCYNKGCGKQFDPEENDPELCTYHPGAPIFHDALKGWSCCKKRRSDFTEFLNIPGCTKGRHSNEKPKEPEKPAQSETFVETEVSPPPQPKPKSTQLEDRPPLDEPYIRLTNTVTSSLKQALEKHMAETNVQSSEDFESIDGIKIGTSCKNGGCKSTYEGEQSNAEKCIFHPGTPVFHEGMKYWSCCQRKTTDFSNFLDQVGCVTGNHVWKKDEPEGAEKTCRLDWFQTGPDVTVSVFAKLAIPEKTYVEANRVSCNIHIVFEGGKSLWTKTLILKDVIVPEKSDVRLLGSKVEINLRKAEAFSWSTLELPAGSS
ncbi:hypothetical protein CHS0354_002848 [Potamilus streckersoni]|uniref:Cysteine and histidine-rich domain-containing protein 1 n=1 Tax=Potamilus streckersoni TaxID=2493646 RepID=A0AAE0VZJ1_9BIVA|nr:hypothetical protein CHS0354_002848 [Potamilus streckersoni]